MFKITDNKGFRLTFANGLTVSVQFGFGNYCENRNMRGGIGPTAPPCKTAEVAVLGPNRLLLPIVGRGDEVEGWCSPEVVADVIGWAQSAAADVEEVPASAFVRHTNPAAFPAIGTTETAMHTVHIAQDGMTLRDWFAGQFMAARLSNSAAPETLAEEALAATAAYRRADAMLKARGAMDASLPTYTPWAEAVWPRPPGYVIDTWNTYSDTVRRSAWVMMWNGGAMAEVGEPSDAELRRYVGEVMAGGPGFASAKKEGT